MIVCLASIGKHSNAIEGFATIFPDLIDIMRERKIGNLNHGISDACKSLRPHPHRMNTLFRSKQLPLSKAGFTEPLATPMCYLLFCESLVYWNLFRIDYLVHDFENTCLDLKPASRRVLIDIGASLEFHSDAQPIATVMEAHAKFRFDFDHICAIKIMLAEPKKCMKSHCRKSILHPIIRSIPVSLILFCLIFLALSTNHWENRYELF